MSRPFLVDIHGYPPKDGLDMDAIFHLHGKPESFVTRVHEDNQNPLGYAFHYKHLPVIDAMQRCLQSQDKSTIFKRLTKNPVFA